MLAKCISACLVLISFLNPGNYSRQINANGSTKYAGGRSNALQAIKNIGLADGAPIGIGFGLNQRLCTEERDYSFAGMSTLEALRRVSKEPGYNVTLDNGVYDLWPPDLTQREQEVLRFTFPRFSAPPTTMSDLGGRLTGYVSMSIEGASGFIVNTLGRPEDEVITISAMTDMTAPQIANQIVQLGSKGMWTMRAMHPDSGPKPGSTVFNIYSYHDSSNLKDLNCPPPVTP